MSAFSPTSAPLTTPPHSAALPSSMRRRVSKWVARRVRISRLRAGPPGRAARSARRCSRAPRSSSRAAERLLRQRGRASCSALPMPDAPAQRAADLAQPRAETRGSATSSDAPASRARLPAERPHRRVEGRQALRQPRRARSRPISARRSPASASSTARSSVTSCTQQRANASSGSTAFTCACAARWARQRVELGRLAPPLARRAELVQQHDHRLADPAEQLHLAAPRSRPPRATRRR